MGNRHIRSLVVALVPVAGLAGAAERSPRLPPDVVAFAQKRDICDHFRGEEGADPARQNEIATALERTCKGTDSKLSALKQAYRSRSAVLKFLGKYEYPIE